MCQRQYFIKSISVRTLGAALIVEGEGFSGEVATRLQLKCRQDGEEPHLPQRPFPRTSSEVQSERAQPDKITSGYPAIRAQSLGGQEWPHLGFGDYTSTGRRIKLDKPAFINARSARSKFRHFLDLLFS